jgi:predicted dehydrogenase
MGKVHLRIYSQMRGVEVAGVMDTDDRSLEEVRQDYPEVSVFDNMDDMLTQHYDAVSVCVPTIYHHPVGLAVIGRGIPLLIEKPLAESVDRGRELVDAAAAGNVPLMVGHLERFNPAVRRIKEIVSADDSDAVISIQIERVGPYPPRIQDVGVIKDLASHDIDLVRHISSAEYKSVYAVTSSTIGEHEDTAIISAEMDNGVLAQMNANWITPYKSRNIRVATNKRYVEGDLITQQVKEYSRFEDYQSSYSVREWPLAYREPVREELTAFLEAIEHGRSMPITGQDGLVVLETIERIEAGLRPT